MTEPKVSERMELLIKRAFYAAYWLGRSPDKQDKIDAEKKATQELTTAIAEIEQRAGKWKEVALAKSLLEIAKCTSNLDDFSTLLKHAVEREKAAIAALGDEWDEAVKEKYHG